jgi:hypothetical protein
VFRLAQGSRLHLWDSRGQPQQPIAALLPTFLDDGHRVNPVPAGTLRIRQQGVGVECQMCQQRKALSTIALHFLMTDPYDHFCRRTRRA